MTAAKKIFLATIGLLVIGMAGWTALDLWGPRSTDLRQFDADDVARRETEMWRSYYDKQRVGMFGEMADLLRHQYHLPLLRSYVVGFQAAKAAFIFKDGATRSDYERALPDLEDYYDALRGISKTPFDANKAAQLELEWWIVHRQRASHPAGDLDDALAALASEIYQMPAERFREYAKYRAEAMTMRDALAAQSGVSDADWQKINDLLRSWRSLRDAVN